jgi:hypothetical protein
MLSVKRVFPDLKWVSKAIQRTAALAWLTNGHKKTP